MKKYFNEMVAIYKSMMDNGEISYDTYERKVEILMERLGLSLSDLVA